MNRFRSDHRWKDRWGGGFVVLLLLMLGVAYWAGDALFGGQLDGTGTDALTSVPSGTTGATAGTAAAAAVDLTGYPRPLTIFAVQAGAFTTPDKAEQHAQALIDKGYPAAISQSGKYHKVFIGAYRTKEAAQAARSHAEGTAGLTLYTAQIDLPSAPNAVLAAKAATASADFQAAVAALSGYLHETANFWDAKAAGTNGAAASTVAEKATGFAQQLTALASKLRTQAGDPAISQLISIAEKVNAASAQQSTLATMADAGPEQLRTAMQGYLTVVNDYRAWTEGTAKS